jgi:hypothetical protein
MFEEELAPCLVLVITILEGLEVVVEQRKAREGGEIVCFYRC